MTPEELVKYADELGLTEKQRAFCLAYATGETAGNGTASARAAGYAGNDPTLAVAARKLVKLGKVREFLPKLLEAAKERALIQTEQAVMSGAEILAGLSAEARASYEDFITINPDGSFAFDLLKAQQAGKLHLIEDLAHDKETGAPIVKLPNRRAAMMDLAKLLRMTEDREVDNRPNLTQILNVFGQMPTEQLKTLREAMSKKDE